MNKILVWKKLKETEKQINSGETFTFQNTNFKKVERHIKSIKSTKEMVVLASKCQKTKLLTWLTDL